MKKSKMTVTDRTITKVTGWIGGIIVIILIVWGIYSLWESEFNEQTNDAQVQEYINPIISRADGFVTAVKFDENEVVKKGDTLIIIDNREYIIQIKQTEASIDRVKAELETLIFKTQTFSNKSNAAKAHIVAAKATLAKQQLDFDRYNNLHSEESATKQKLEHIEAQLEVDKSNLESVKEEYYASISEIQDVDAQKHVLKAEKNRLEALLERHKLDLSYTIITASYDGRMGRRTIEIGQMIDVGQVLAYIVNNETDKWVVANYKETQIEGMKVGDKVTFTADAYSFKVFQGEIISISPATGSSFSLLPPDNSTGNYVKIVQRIPVRIKVLGNKKELDLLKVGMNVNVTIPKK